MLFNSFEFIGFFLLVYALYLVLRLRAQNLMLLAASYWFYGTWDWRFLGLIVASTLVDYLCGIRIHDSSNARARAAWLILSMVTNLGILFVFKYFNFFAGSLAELMGRHADLVTLKLVLPVGISFYTFQTMSYTIDVYRGSMKPTRDFANFALFVAFFPQLVAGPIERASRLLPQIEGARKITLERFREGAWLILLGFFMKVVMADNLGQIVDEDGDGIFARPGDALGIEIPLTLLAFAFQIYGDFAGYSNIARGVSKLMGIDLMVNFRMPYFAVNPSDFWRRWHISLSSWLRDYLYIPLGGNRFGRWSTYRNLAVTMLLGGLWHGAAWHFVAWGAYHGALLIAHRLLLPVLNAVRPTGRIGAPVWHLFSLGCFFGWTLFGWLLFRVEQLSDIPLLLRQTLKGIRPEFILNGKVVMLTMLCFVTPVLLMDFLQERKKNDLVIKTWPAPLRLAVYLGLFAGIIMFGRMEERAFIYFQF